MGLSVVIHVQFNDFNRVVNKGYPVYNKNMSLKSVYVFIVAIFSKHSFKMK